MVGFLEYLALDIPANCICEIHTVALDDFYLNTVHKLSSKEKTSQLGLDSNPGLLGGKQICYLCSMLLSHTIAHSISFGFPTIH